MIEDYQALSNAPNDPELNGKYLGLISSDFAKVAHVLKEAAYQIKARGFSNYPLFVISRQALDMGSQLIGMGELQGNTWIYRASFMEEFLQRGLIAPENQSLFEDNYKDIAEFCCLFVVDGAFTNFIFIPYPEDLESED